MSNNEIKNRITCDCNSCRLVRQDERQRLAEQVRKMKKDETEAKSTEHSFEIGSYNKALDDVLKLLEETK